MNQKANFFKIGLFVIGAIGLGLAAAVILGAGKWFESKTLVETYFTESVQGLEVGAPVRLRGVHVGRVESIKLAREEYKVPVDPVAGVLPYKGVVVVRMSIRPSIAVHLSEIDEEVRMKMAADAGFRFRLGAQGITGVLYIESEFLDPDRYPPMEISWKPKTPYIPSAPSTISELGADLQSITRKLEQLEIDKIGKNLDLMLTTVTQVVREIQSEHVIADAKQLLHELHGAVVEARRVIDNPQLDKTLRDSAAAMEDFRKASADLSRSAKDVRQAVTQLPEVMTRLNKTVRRVDALLASKGETVDELLENLRTVSEELTYFTKTIEQYPSQVFFGEPPPRTQAVKR